MSVKQDNLQKIKEMVDFVIQFNSYERVIKGETGRKYYYNQLTEEEINNLKEGEIGEKAYELLSNPDKYIEEKIKYIKIAEQLKNLAKKYENNFTLRGKFSYTNDEDLGKLYNYFENHDNELNDDDFLEENELSTKENTHYIDDQYLSDFNNLKTNPDFDAEKAQEIKEAIWSREKYLSAHFEELEMPVENSTYLYSAREIDKEIEKDPEIKKGFDPKKISRAFDSTGNQKTAQKVIKNYEYKLEEKNKEPIINIIKMLEKGHFLDGVNNGHEQQEKVYGLKRIKEKRDEIIDAISRNNFNEAYEKTQEYKTSINEMKEIYDYARTAFPQDGFHVPGNVSCLRTEYMPEELVLDVQVHSQVNGVFNFVGFCRSKNYDPIDFIKNPNKYQNKIKQESLDNFMKEHNVKKNGSLKEKGKALSYLSQNRAHATQAENRAFETIFNIESNHENVINNAIIREVNNGVSNTYGRYPGMYPFSKTDTKADYEQIRNYIAAGEFYDVTEFLPKCYNVITGENFKTTFNYDEFLENDNRSTIEKYSSVMDRLASGAYEVEVEKNESRYEEAGNYNYSTFLVCAKSYFEDLLMKEKAKENPDNCSIDLINEFLINPCLCLKNYTESKFKNELKAEIDGFSEISSAFNPGDYENELEKCDLKKDNTFDLEIKNKIEMVLEDNNDKTSLELKETFEQYLDNKGNVNLDKENKIDIIAIGYLAAERYSSKTILDRWFTKDGWRERSIINNLKKAYSKQGINGKAFEDVFFYNVEDFRKEKMLKCVSALNYKENLDKFNGIKNAINSKDLSSNEPKEKIFKDSIEDIKRIDALINMDLVPKSDIKKLKKIQTKAIKLLVQKGVDKDILDNEFGKKIEEKVEEKTEITNEKVPVFSSDKELNIGEPKVELSKEVKIEDPEELLNNELQNKTIEKE